MFILLMALCVGFSSCSRDDEEEENTEETTEDGYQTGGGQSDGSSTSSSSKSPYKSFLYCPWRSKNKYIEMTNGRMFLEINTEAVHNTGTNYKAFVIQKPGTESWLRLEYSYYQYEIPTDPKWLAGTYTLTGSKKHTYACRVHFYENAGISWIKGKAKISYVGNKVVVDVNGKIDNEGDTYHILHYEGTFVEQ